MPNGYPHPDEYYCNLCGEKMRLIKGRRSIYWECTGFPECRYTVEYLGGLNKSPEQLEEEWEMENQEGFIGEVYEKGIDEATKLIDLNPHDARAYYRRGIIYNQLEKYEKALKDYDKVLELEPDNQDVIDDRNNLLKEHPELKP